LTTGDWTFGVVGDGGLELLEVRPVIEGDRWEGKALETSGDSGVELEGQDIIIGSIIGRRVFGVDSKFYEDVFIVWGDVVSWFASKQGDLPVHGLEEFVDVFVMNIPVTSIVEIRE
jgi:hypothetical protein